MNRSELDGSEIENLQAQVSSATQPAPPSKLPPLRQYLFELSLPVPGVLQRNSGRILADAIAAIDRESMMPPVTSGES